MSISSAFSATKAICAPFFAGFAVMRLIVAPVALASLFDVQMMFLCTANASQSAPVQNQQDDMTGGCVHMLRPRKTLLLKI